MKRMRRLLVPDDHNPDRAPEHLPGRRSERGERRDPPPPFSTARLGVGGVPLFPNTPRRVARRSATRKLAPSGTGPAPWVPKKQGATLPALT
jgi:hypothetical protein